MGNTNDPGDGPDHRTKPASPTYAPKSPPPMPPSTAPIWTPRWPQMDDSLTAQAGSHANLGQEPGYNTIHYAERMPLNLLTRKKSFFHDLPSQCHKSLVTGLFLTSSSALTPARSFR